MVLLIISAGPVVSQNNRQNVDTVKENSNLTVDDSSLFSSLNKQAITVSKYKDIDSTIVYFNQALSQARTNKDTVELINTLNAIGYVYIERGRSASAKQMVEYFSEVLSNKQQSLQDYKEPAINTYQMLTKADSTLGNYEESLTHLKNYHNLKKTLLDEVNKEKVDQLEKEYQIKEKGKEIELLSAENEIQSLITLQQRRLIFWILGISALLVLFLAVLYNRYRLKKRSMTIIEEKSKENEVLVQEVHHRVKNNLQIMLSLLNTQINLIEDERAKSMVAESGNRIKSMALIHQNLYQSGNLIMVQAESYFQELTKNVANSFKDESKNINITTNIITEEIRMTIAVPVGLILNELITNSFKYAFEGMHEGELIINFNKVDEDSRYHLQVIDNGQGVPEEFSVDTTDSFGLRLVKGLTEQLDGDLALINEGGTKFDIYVSDKDVA